MHDCNKCCQITGFIRYIHFWNQGGIIISNYDISLQFVFSFNFCCFNSCWKNAWLQLFFYNTENFIYRMGGCSWNCESTQYLSNTCQLHFIYSIHGCNCSSKKYRIPGGMDGRSYFREITKHCTPKKNCSLRLNAVTCKEKFFFWNNYFRSQPFLMSCYFTKIFVHLPVIAPVCYFSVYKLIGGTQ